MNICILTPRYPFPENGGDVLRINNIARYLKAKGHTLTLVSFKETNKVKPDKEGLYDNIVTVKRNKLLALVYTILSFFKGQPLQCGYYKSATYSKTFRKVIRENNFDLYVSHLLRMVPYLEENSLQDKSIVEMTDALSKTYSLSSGAYSWSLLKFVYYVEKGLINKYEQRIIDTFPKVVLVSTEDIDILTRNQKKRNVVLHTNGVEINENPPRKCNPNKITYIGNMRTLQNEDAVVHFAKDIFPIILQQIPKAEFYIVGNAPTNTIKALACDNIIVTGFVDDLNATINDSCVVVAPVRIAAGIQNKVLVAMANKLPVVLTSLISAAIPELKDGKNCFICDNDRDFAEVCVGLMSNGIRRDDIADEGYRMVKDRYSWNTKMEGYENL